MPRFDRDIGDGPAVYFDEKAPLPRDRRLQPRPPKKFKVEKVGSGVRCTVSDREHEDVEESGTGSVEYHIHWAESVDMTTEQGLKNGFKRSTLLSPPIPAPGRDSAEASAVYNDPKYATGYFFCTGVDAFGERSEPTVPHHISDGTGGGVPDDVTHFRVSESGEQHDLTVLSAVSYSFILPSVLKNLTKIQFYFQNYPSLNQISEGESVYRTAGAGGSQTGVLRLPVARRRPVAGGTASLTNGSANVSGGSGTNFLAIAAVGDYIEAYGVRAQIATIINGTQLTLTANWSGPSLGASTEFVIIGSVTIYAVSIGPNGERRDDVTEAPSATVVLDGEMSAPTAPTLNGQVLAGNIVRLYIEPAVGSHIVRYNIWRGTGAGVAFSSTSIRATIQPEHNHSNASLSWDDSNFTVYEKEQGQTFSYYVTAVNARDQEGSESARKELSCRLDTSQDTDPNVTARVGLKNLLYNGFISGTSQLTVSGATNATPITITTTANHGFATGKKVLISGVLGNTAANGQWTITVTAATTFTLDTSVGNGAYTSGGTVYACVEANDTTQDTNFGGLIDGSNALGRPYGAAAGQLAGTGRWRGYTRWESFADSPASLAVHQNANEVRFPAPGAGKSCYVYQEIDAWDSTAGVNFIKVRKDTIVVFSGFLKHNGVAATAGTFHIYLEHYNNNALTGNAYRRYRDTDSSLQEVQSALQIDATTISSAWRRYYAVFRLKSSVGTTKQLRLTFRADGITGGDVVLTMPMKNEGEEIAFWTGEMGVTDLSVPVAGGDPPSELGDGVGFRRGYIDQPNFP